MAEERDDGLMEAIKDFFGVMDDANDFLDRLREKQRKIKSMMMKFSSMSDTQRATAERMLQTGKDGEAMKDIMKKLDIRRPIFFGTTILRKLQDHNRDLGKLETKLNKMPPKVKSQVKPLLNTVRRQLNAGMRKHVSVIQVFTRMQENSLKFWRAVAKGALVAGAAAALTASALTIGVSIAEQARQVKDIRDFTDWLGTGLNELAMNVSSLHKGVKAGQHGDVPQTILNLIGG